MDDTTLFDEELVRRLPLPLAQLYRRADCAVDPLKRHLAAFDLWEASLLLLASTAIVEYAERADPDPQIVEKLKNLARPHLGQWWELVRLLVPALVALFGRAGMWPGRNARGGRVPRQDRASALRAGTGEPVADVEPARGAQSAG